jgi:prefoldin subunit 5
MSETTTLTKPNSLELDSLQDDLSKNLEHLNQKITKINQAQEFLEDIGDRLLWALDFGDCQESVEPISNVLDSLFKAQEKLEESSQKLEDVFETFKEKKSLSLKTLNKELEEELSFNS